MFDGANFVLRHVRDLEQTRTFYTDVLGFRVADEQEGYVRFDHTTGANLALSTEQTGEETEIWWYVDNADAIHDHFQSHGAEIVSPPKDEPYGRTVVVRDPSGTNLYFLQLPVAA